jgi:hypothetical protein
MSGALPLFFSCGSTAQPGSGPPHCWGFESHAVTHSVEVPRTSDRLVADASLPAVTLTTNIHAHVGNRTRMPANERPLAYT